MLWHRCSDPAAWLDVHGQDTDWIHPRYREVVDGEDPGLQTGSRQHEPRGQPTG